MPAMVDSMEHKDKRSELGKALCDAVLSIIPENGEEKWGYVDEHIGEISESDFQWLENVGLYDRNPNMRDLAATAMADTRYKISSKGLEKLRRMTVLDQHPAAKFRAAVALYTRNAPSVTVMNILEDAEVNGDGVMKEAVRRLFEKFPKIGSGDHTS
jgi:hypothetical protein